MVSAKAVGAGAFVVISGLLFAVVLFMIGERRMLFEDRYTLYTEFDRLGPLEPGAIVRVAGLNAGEVTAIEVPRSPAEKFRVKMEIREDLRGLIRTDSVATAQTEGLVGGIHINIASGTEAAPQVLEDGTIPGRELFGMADLLQQTSETVALINETVERLSGDLEKAIQRVAMTTEDAHVLLTDITPEIKALATNGARISADTQAMVARVNSGEGTLGKLINDDSVYRQVQELTQEAGAVMTNVRQVTDEARRAIADFRSEDGPAQGMFADVKVTLSQAREVTADMADNMEALKHNFLLRGFFNRRGYYDLDAISPAQYRSGVLENGKRKAMRIWLGAPVLFEAGANGTEELTGEGRARIDSAMTTFVRHLPSNPLVIEGYATEGTVGERYRLSRQRAGIVREYVLGRFGLMPQHTGFIALADDAVGSPSPGGDDWDGVALTLFVDLQQLQFAPQPRSAGFKEAIIGQ